MTRPPLRPLRADKPQYDRVTSFITKRAPLWQARMGLAHYEIEHAFLDSYFGDDGEEDFKVTASTESRWQYMQAKVKWYLPSAVRHSNDHLDDVLVHELCHVLLAPEQAHALAKHAEHIELATESVVRAVLAGWKVNA